MEIIPDARSLNTTGEGWYNIGAIEAKGDRDRKALALELAVPVVSRLDASLAARIDHYSDASDISGRHVGADEAPLPRNRLAQAARRLLADVPRAGHVQHLWAVRRFADRRRLLGTRLLRRRGLLLRLHHGRDDAPAGHPLTEEHGDDCGFGFIWQPVTNFMLTADWYQIELNDLVVTETAYDTLLREWQCDNGVLDGSSQLCADVRNRITRNGFGAVEQVTIQPINQDSVEREGVDLRASYRYESERFGAFSSSLSYSKVLKYELNRFAGDESVNLRYGWIGQATPENSLALTRELGQPALDGQVGRRGDVPAARRRHLQLLADAVHGTDVLGQPDGALPVQRASRGQPDRQQPAVHVAAGQRRRHLAVLLAAVADRRRARPLRLPVAALLGQLTWSAAMPWPSPRYSRSRCCPAAAVRAEPGAHADSPLKLTEIIARPKVVDLKVSPDGRYFAATAVTDDGKTMLHILDRKTMSVVHSEVYEGPLGVGEFTWHDANHLLITSSYKSALAEGRGSAGVFILDIRSKDIRRVWGGEGSSDYGGFEGGDLGATHR